jgi:hypothetical protein
MYTDCYDVKHKAIKIEPNKIISKAQKGVYSSIICPGCEKKTQKYDHYASLIMTTRSPLSPKYLSIKRETTTRRFESESVSYSEWKGIDFFLFQKFVFSILLKTHLYYKKEGEYLLIEKHWNNILDLYTSTQIVDDSSYPIVVSALQGNHELNNHVLLPCRKNAKGHCFVEFAGCGFIFSVYVSSHSKPQHVLKLKLNKNGNVLIPHVNIKETGVWRKLKAQVNEK